MREKHAAKKSSAAEPDFSIAARFGQQQAEAFLAMQRELYALAEEANRNWLSRAELERKLAAELVTSLTGAKTPADAADVYQEWMTRRMKLLAEDGQKLFDDGQKFVAAATRFLSNGAAVSN